MHFNAAKLYESEKACCLKASDIAGVFGIFTCLKIIELCSKYQLSKIYTASLI